ncbi:hypothetical protein [Thermocrinis sp.]
MGRWRRVAKRWVGGWVGCWVVGWVEKVGREEGVAVIQALP